jgi:group I intron endonuclease
MRLKHTKDEMKKSGIYQIRNLTNNKIYLGSSKQFSSRLRSHKSLLLQKKKHHAYKLQRAINKYGLSNFIFEIIELVPESSLMEIEQEYLDILKPYSSKGYNTSQDATFGRYPGMSLSIPGEAISKAKGAAAKISAARKRNINLYSKLFTGVNNPSVKLTVQQVLEVKKAIYDGMKKCHIKTKYAQKFNVSEGCIESILQGKNWKSVSYSPTNVNE